MYSKIPTYEEAFNLCEATPAFSHSVQTVGGYAVHSFKYNLSYDEMWDDVSDGRLNLRGLTFINGKMVACPFPKFFNINENKYARVDPYDAISIYEKVDGSLISFFRLPNGEVELKTMKSVLSDVAIQARRFLYASDAYASILPFVESLLDQNLSPMFEFVSPDNRIVLEYTEDRLIFLGARDMTSGETLFSDNICFQSDVDFFKIDVPKSMNWQQYTEHMNRTDVEGAVLVYEDGTIVKTKTADYFLKHKVISNLNEKTIYEHILSGSIDDLFGLIGTHFPTEMDSVNKIVKDFWYHYKDLEAKAMTFWNAHKDWSRKDIGLKYMNSQDASPEDKFLATCTFMIIKDNGPGEAFSNAIMKKTYEELLRLL